MPVVTCTPIGRFGNQLFSYAFARGYAEQHGYDFQCCRWIGQKAFELSDHRITKHNLPDKNELTANGEGDIHFHTYGQSQKAITYTRRQVREWFKIRSSILEQLVDMKEPLMAHIRRGDYSGYGYPVISMNSYHSACAKYGLNVDDLNIANDERPTLLGNFPYPLDFMPDWMRLVRASILLRANSSFSWWAAVIGNPTRVFSPIIEGLKGGTEHDVEFVPGNWPRLANHDFTTDLHLED